MHMTRQKEFEGVAQMGLGSDHINLGQKNSNTKNPNVKILQGNAMSETLQNRTFGGGVTHRIGSIRPRHGAQLSWRSEVKFHVNVFTLRM